MTYQSLACISILTGCVVLLADHRPTQRYLEQELFPGWDTDQNGGFFHSDLMKYFIGAKLANDASDDLFDEI